MTKPETFLDGRISLYCGDCLVAMDEIAENSIDSCVTDPPYHLTSIVKRFGSPNSKAPISAIQRRFASTGAAMSLGPDGQPTPDQYGRLSRGFMGKQWDGGDVAFNPETWAKVYRVLKPGAHLLAFGGTRTYHRMACAIEDAGFEIRDCIMWLYGSGFPKSHDVSKGIDRAAGAERKVVGRDMSKWRDAANYSGGKYGEMSASHYETKSTITLSATDAARQWEGWGTALKPACELIILARKPLSEGTVAANVLKWGTGAINVDGCRVEGKMDGVWGTSNATCTPAFNGSPSQHEYRSAPHDAGRWPANVIHDGSEEVMAGFPQQISGGTPPSRPRDKTRDVYGAFKGQENPNGIGSTSGSAARFFYCVKADSDDRLGSKHPTVKPLDLMQYLVRLITPKGGVALDPFAGTGTTGEAAYREGMNAILIEREAEYQSDIRRRIELIGSSLGTRRIESAKARGKIEGHDNLPLFK